jgi:SAM-dependent methyltransferase
MVRTHTILCNLCDSDDAAFLFKAKDRLHGIEGEFDYVRCNQCGLVYMNPQVVSEDIARLYPADYAPHYYGPQNRKYKILYSLWGKIFTVAKIKNSIYRRLNQQNRVLDIGCGSGTFLNKVRADKGCEVCGVEISQDAVVAARDLFKLDIFRGEINEAPWPDGYFDVITAWWYLEHITTPNAAVEKMSRLLKKGGCCIIGVPNFNSFNARHFKEKWYHLDCPRHLTIWTPQTITKLMRKYGLKVMDVVYDRTPWGLVGSLQYIVYEDNVNPRHRDRILRSNLLRVFLLPWTLLLSLFKKSDTIIVYAQKTS